MPSYIALPSMTPMNSNSARCWSCARLDAGLGYSRWSGVSLNRPYPGSNASFVSALRKSLKSPPPSTPASSSPNLSTKRILTWPLSAETGAPYRPSMPSAKTWSRRTCTWRPPRPSASALEFRPSASLSRLTSCWKARTRRAKGTRLGPPLSSSPALVSSSRHSATNRSPALPPSSRSSSSALKLAGSTNWRRLLRELSCARRFWTARAAPERPCAAPAAAPRPAGPSTHSSCHRHPRRRSTRAGYSDLGSGRPRS
mmetsp:Transcript_15567/g.53186  ORF Transcript_15567/g.53186 Transcript_15567/m.53186 type:complete len:256 (-) Transcript_15567:103-870(-)